VINSDIAYGTTTLLDAKNDLTIDKNSLKNLKVPFIENQGQLDAEYVKFYADMFAGTINSSQNPTIHQK